MSEALFNLPQSRILSKGDQLHQKAPGHFREKKKSEFYKSEGWIA